MQKMKKYVGKFTQDHLVLLCVDVIDAVKPIEAEEGVEVDARDLHACIYVA
jgi:hypothetical protein